VPKKQHKRTLSQAATSIKPRVPPRKKREESEEEEEENSDAYEFQEEEEEEAEGNEGIDSRNIITGKRTRGVRVSYKDLVGEEEEDDDDDE
jgi:hypothetical protein